MTRVEVLAGVCGHAVVIEAVKLDGAHVRVTVDSACEQVMAMNPDLVRLQWRGKGHTVFKRMTESVVYQSAARHIRHAPCPIPAAILKAIEVEVGLALARDVTITFVRPGVSGSDSGVAGQAEPETTA